MSFYMNSISGGNTIGPLICGFIITGTSWRWLKWIAFILAFINFLVVVLFCPETRYDRSGLLKTTSTPTTPSSTSIHEDDHPADTPLDKPPTSTSKELSSPTPVPKKTWKQELRLFSGVPRQSSLLKLFLRPLPLILYPAVILSFLTYSVSLAWVVAINVLNPFVLQAPPYNWAPSVNGLINITGLIGNLVGAWLGGWVVDRYCDWRSKRNGGVFQPEMRLHLLFIPALVVPAGCLAFGFGVGRELNWTAL